MKLVLIAATWMTLPAAAWTQTSEPMPYAIQRRNPAFADALITTVKQWDPSQNPGASFQQTAGTNPSPETLAKLYVNQALSNPTTLAEASAFLEERGEPGRQAKARLLELTAQSRETRQALAQTKGVSARIGTLQKADWSQFGSRGVFDGGTVSGGAAAMAAGPAAPRSAAALAPASKQAPPAVPAKEENPDASVVRLVSISVEKLQELAVNKDPNERKLQLEKPFGLGVGPISGAGVFTSKVLSDEDVQADPAKLAAAAEAAKKGVPVDFVRTNSKIQLMGTFILPVDIPGNPGEANLGFRKGGVVEIVETRSVAHGTDSHPDHKTFLWPLTAQHLREVMKPGEDITVTGRIEGSGALVGGIGQGIDFPYYGSVNGKLEAGVGGAMDKWMSLHIKKVDADHVRVFLEKGDGKAFRVHLEAAAGLDLNSDDFIPHVPPSTMEETMVGKAVVVGGDNSMFAKLEDLGKAELSAEFRRSKHNLQSEGWASVSLSDPKSAGALDDFFKAHPAALRSLPADSTVDPSLGAGRFNAEVREVTKENELEAHLSFLHITRSSGNKHFEVRWRQDNGTVAHYLIVIGEKEFEENINKTDRSQESAMWYDLNTGEASISVKLGPQDRLLTTTREHINDVIALQKALGLDLETGKINEPHPYLQFLGLANYGRSSESGQFVLGNAGIQALKNASPEALLIAYLRADWLFEKESYAPGKTWVSASKAPPWAATADPAAFKPALDFLRRNASEAMRDDRGQADSNLSYQYDRVAPGRWLRADAWRFLAAQEYADRVVKMQRAGNDPAHLLNLFLKFRRDHTIELKRSVVATASLAGRSQEEGKDAPNFAGYIEMTGTRVTLNPKMKPIELPDSPVDKIQDIVKQWQ